MVVTVLEFNAAKSLPCLEWGMKIVIHLFKFIRVISLVYKEALFGTRVREPARVSFVPGAAQVSLWRGVTFLSS